MWLNTHVGYRVKRFSFFTDNIFNEEKGVTFFRFL
nr:MAG TPA: hypothetical protein [Caudoviricetes sp.]